MDNVIFKRLLAVIKEERESFDTLTQADNALSLNVTSDDIIDFLEFSKGEKTLNYPIVGNILITEGDILSILKIIHDIILYEGEFILFINGDNLGTITYLVDRANKIYQELNIDVKIILDYSENYNKYLSKLVTIVGSKDFVNTASKDFVECNQVIA